MKTESPSATIRSYVSEEKLGDMQKTDSTLNMRMHIMRERFKNLVSLDDNESHSDASSPLAGTRFFFQLILKLRGHCLFRLK